MIYSESRTQNFQSRRELCRLQPRIDREQGGVWIWLIILIVAGAAVGGGVYFLDKTKLETGTGLVSEAEKSLSEGNFAEAQEKAEQALAQLTAVTEWTPFNKEVLKPEKQAATIHLRARYQQIKTADPKIARLLLSQLQLLDAEAAASLIKERDKLEAQAFFKEVEKKLPPERLQQFWNDVSQGKALDPKQIEELGLTALTTAGVGRSQIRNRVAAVVKSLVGELQKPLDKQSSSTWQNILTQLKSDALLKSADMSFKDYPEDLKGLKARVQAALGVAVAGNSQFQNFGQLQEWYASIKSTPAFLGDLADDVQFKGFTLAPAPDFKSPEFSSFKAVMTKQRHTLTRDFEDLKVIANDFRAMSLVAKSSDTLVFLDRTEVTVEQFKKFVERDKGYGLAGKKFWSTKGWEKKETNQWQGPLDWQEVAGKEFKDYPVVGLSFCEAEAFARSVSKRLPTLEEWLGAWGNDPYPWGSDWNPSFANFRKSFTDKSKLRASLKRGTCHAKFDDLLGNAAEFVAEGGEDARKYWLVGGSFLKIADDTTVKTLATNDRKRVLLQPVDTFLVIQRREAGLRLAKTLKWDSARNKPIPTAAGKNQ